MQILINQPSWKPYDYNTKSMIFIHLFISTLVVAHRGSCFFEGPCGARCMFGWMPFRTISATHRIIHCSTNFWCFASNMPRTASCISKWNTGWNAWSKTPNQVCASLTQHSFYFLFNVWKIITFFFFFPFATSQSINLQASSVFWLPTPI